MSTRTSANRDGSTDPRRIPGPIDSHQLISTYLSSPTIGFCLVDQHLRYVTINETLARIDGLPLSQHIGKTMSEVLGNFFQMLEPSISAVFLKGEPQLNLHVSGQLLFGTEVGHWIDHFFPIKNEQGQVLQVAIVVAEVTEQRRLESTLKALQHRFQFETERLEMLLDVNKLLASNWDLTRVFPKISARIRRVLRQEYAAYALQDVESGLLVRRAIDFPLSKGLSRNVPIRTEYSPSGLALQKGTSKIYSREEMETFNDDTAKSFLGEGLHSLCCVPLQRPKGPLGVLILGSTRQNAFKKEDLRVLEQVAAQIALAIENHSAISEVDELKRRLSEERAHLEGEVRQAEEFSDIIGQSPALNWVLGQVLNVAPSEATVLVLGETGTGKELIARAIHRLSRRKNGPFIKLNCAAIPTGLLESELFGHEKGAFTGAISQKIGRMELAHGGTLFLDEVGEIPLELQPKLLRVLQDQEFERLGSNRTIRVSVRLVAATNRNLKQEVTNHQFRSDLYYRLSVFPIHMPALRDRREDIPMLVRHFVRKFSSQMGRHLESMSTETMKALTEWSWPGNVRELENLIERAVILSDGRVLLVPLSELRAQPAARQRKTDDTLGNAERQHIVRVLRETRGVLSGPDGAARKLGLARTTLQSKIKRLKIEKEEYVRPEPGSHK